MINIIHNPTTDDDKYNSTRDDDKYNSTFLNVIRTMTNVNYTCDYYYNYNS